MSRNEQSNFCKIVVVLPGCFCSHVCAFDRLIAPMRSIKPPVRFANPIYYVHACKKRMMPFEGQPRKWKLVRRFPRLEVRYSSILNAGFGLFVAEDVKAGQPIATYRRKPWQRSSRGRYRTYLIQMSFPIRTLRCFWNMHFDVFEQGNRHIRANHAACCCLDSKPASSAEIESFCATQDVAGLANSSQKPNAVFVDVGYDTVLEAKVDLVKGTEVLPKYALA